jgi:hypothetical protein
MVQEDERSDSGYSRSWEHTAVAPVGRVVVVVVEHRDSTQVVEEEGRPVESRDAAGTELHAMAGVRVKMAAEAVPADHVEE